MLICSLHKPESTLDQVRKSYPKLKPTDAALLATAIVLGGRYAIIAYDGQNFEWPADYRNFTLAYLKELSIIQQSVTGTTKRSARTVVEEEPIEVNINIVPNYLIGEKLLDDREDLKTLLSDILQAGVEFSYTPGDVGWLWALERVNWNVLSNGEFTRKLHFKGVFADNSVGVEFNPNAPKKRVPKSVKTEEVSD